MTLDELIAVKAGVPAMFAWTVLPSRCRKAVPSARSVIGPPPNVRVQRALPTGHSRWLISVWTNPSFTRWYRVVRVSACEIVSATPNGKSAPAAIVATRDSDAPIGEVPFCVRNRSSPPSASW